MSWDVVVVGGGLAGAAAAARLAMAGRRVVLFERERGPHDKVCGEFLSGEAAAELAALDAAARPAWVPRRSSACASSSGAIAAAADLAVPRLGPVAPPARRAGCWRRRRDAASRSGAAQRSARSRPTARACGCDCRRRRRARPRRRCSPPASTICAAGGGPAHRRSIGLKLHLRLDEAQRRALAGSCRARAVRRRLCRAAAGRGRHGQPVPGRVAASASRRSGATGAGSWPTVPHLAARLDGARALHARPLAVAGMPYGYLRRGDAGKAPVYRLGDQAAVIPSFTGDGMAMALHSARHAADAILAGRSPRPSSSVALTAAFRRPVRLAGLLAALARRAGDPAPAGHGRTVSPPG